MNEEEQMYKEADYFLQTLDTHKSQEETEKIFSSFDMQESVLGLLTNEGLITYMNISGHYVITQLGKAALKRGGLRKRYLKQKRKERATFIGAIFGIIAAIASVATLIIELCEKYL